MPENSRFNFHPSAAENIDKKAADLLCKITLVTLADRPKDFPSERPIAAVINSSELMAEPEYGNMDRKGRWVERVFLHEGSTYAILQNDYKTLQALSDTIASKDWPKTTLSRRFIEDTLFDWCRKRSRGVVDVAFSHFLIEQAKSQVKDYKTIVPIALMEIERSMNSGRAMIIPVKQGMIDEIEAEAVSNCGKQFDAILKMFADVRSKIQGLAAVEITVTGERLFVSAEALRVADQVVSFLRLYSSAAYESDEFCPIAIKGSEFAPQTEVLQLSDDGDFCFAEEARETRFWQINDAESSLIEQSGWSNLVSLLLPNLSNYEKKLKTTVLTYSKGLTFPDLSDRLVYILSALEGMLIKDNNEPIQQNLGDRIAFAIGDNHEKRKLIVANIKKIYKIRSEYIHHREQNYQEEEAVGVFYGFARDFLHFAIANSKTYESTEDLISWIDGVKYGA